MATSKTASSPSSLRPPSADALALARKVNAELRDARVHFYETAGDPPQFGMLMEAGSRRRTVTQSYPFDDAATIVEAVRRWASQAAQGARYTYDPPDEDA